MIRDLLNPALGYLELREDSKGVIQVAGITEVSTINAKEASLMQPVGQWRRTLTRACVCLGGAQRRQGSATREPLQLSWAGAGADTEDPGRHAPGHTDPGDRPGIPPPS